MKNSAVNHHKTHRPRRWRGSWWATAGVLQSGLRPGPAVPEAPEPPGPGRRFPLSPPESLNWSLRRYVPTSSLRVWLLRQTAGAGRANALPGWNGPLRACGWQAGARPPVLRERAYGGSRPRGGALRHRARGNRQMEHLVQVALSVRGGVRCGSVIARRERAAAGGLILTTLGSRAGVQSNIFKFVMT
jgi:hypothetical protein